MTTRYRLTDASNDDGRVYGTWDFKWPQGAVIRVAFQDWPDGPSDPELEGIKFDTVDPWEARLLEGHKGYARLTRIVECLARRWLAEAPNIKFKFQHEGYIAAPPGRLGTSTGARPRRRKNWRNRVLAWKRWTSRRDGQARPPTSPGSVAPRYDVLVSLAPLPVLQRRQALRADGTAGPAEKKYFLPGSELGRYAQRIDYGVPTTYLGKREHLAGSLAHYFSSPEFRHWVIHEFGHVLGLPHEQQNPNLRGRIELKPTGQLVDILRTSLGYPADAEQDITAAEVDEEIVRPWPTLTPNHPFCDFRLYGEDDPADDDASVMFHLYWKRLLAGRKADAPAVYHERPLPRDLQVLDVMYPKRYAASESNTRAA